MSDSTTIRVPVELRERLRRVSQDRHASLTDTLRDALEALRREEFYESLARSEDALRADPAAWADYLVEAEMWAGDLDRTGALGTT
ncbi:MAG: hypothetical protein AB7V43_09520 [Acidimicrobiia bacterium]